MLNHPNDQVGAEVLAFLSVFMHDGNARVQVKHDSLAAYVRIHFIIHGSTRVASGVSQVVEGNL